MSFIICKECKYQAYCTFPSTGRVQQCDEFEDASTAPSFEWNLQDMLKLWPTDTEDSISPSPAS